MTPVALDEAIPHFQITSASIYTYARGSEGVIADYPGKKDLLDLDINEQWTEGWNSGFRKFTDLRPLQSTTGIVLTLSVAETVNREQIAMTICWDGLTGTYRIAFQPEALEALRDGEKPQVLVQATEMREVLLHLEPSPSNEGVLEFALQRIIHARSMYTTMLYWMNSNGTKEHIFLTRTRNNKLFIHV